LSRRLRGIECAVIYELATKIAAMWTDKIDFKTDLNKFLGTLWPASRRNCSHIGCVSRIGRVC